MDRVEELLRRYQVEHRTRGTADPRPYLAELEGDDRRELAALIDAFLSRAPEPEFDPERFAAFRESDAGRLATDLVARATSDEDLVALRNDARLTRARLVRALAEKLGLAGREPAVAHRYHQLEQGLLEPAGVSERVWDALGDVLQRSAETVRAAAPRPRPGAAGPVFARQAFPEGERAPEAPPAGRPDDEDPEVDALFLGPGG